MHFVYKLYHLFQSTRVSHENSSVTNTFHVSKLISTQDFFCIQHAIFKATYCNFNTFWLHLVFFMPLMIYFQLYDLEIAKGYNLNSEKVETWHGIIIWPTYLVCKCWEDYGKNWMHFVYKLDYLFQSTRVSDENSCVSKAFHFSKLISTQDFFCIQHAIFKATYWNFNPFWLHLLFFMHLLNFFGQKIRYIKLLKLRYRK